MQNTTYQAGTLEEGKTSSEFIALLLTHLIAGVVSVVTLFQPSFQLDQLKAIIPAIAIVVSAVAQLFYARNRTALKIATTNAVAGVETAKATAGQPSDNTSTETPSGGATPTTGNGGYAPPPRPAPLSEAKIRPTDQVRATNGNYAHI